MIDQIDLMYLIRTRMNTYLAFGCTVDEQNIHCIAAYSALYGSYFLTYCGDRSDESIMLIVVCLVLWICPGFRQHNLGQRLG